jgi:hypothetical protein
MKKALFTLAIATLAISTVSYGQAKQYAITNDDINGTNMVGVFSSTSGGPITEVDTSTGGSGIGGGYFANNRIAIQNNGKCLFASNASSETIAAFKVGAGLSLTPATGSPFATGGSGAFYGVGLAVTPQNNALFATLDSQFEIAEFTIGAGCTLTAVGTVPEGDYVGPMAVTQDGKVLVVSGPNNSYLDAWTIGAGAQLTKLGSTVSLNGVVSSCSVGCYPTGLDTSKVIGGNTNVVAGNATLSGPYYITTTLNESSGLSQANANTFLVGNTTLANVESPWYSSAAHDDLGTGWIYLCAAGFGTGYPAGFAVNHVASGAISSTATSSLVNSAAFYASSCQSTGHQSNPKNEYVWQSGVNSSLQNTMYYYLINGATGAVSLVQSKSNTAAQGNTYVLTLAAWPGRHGLNK